MACLSSRRAFLLTCSACGAGLASGWRKKPFPEWDDDTVLRVLVDSPWAKTRTVRFTWVKEGEQPITYKDVPGARPGGQASATIPGGSPVGGIGAPKPKIPNEAHLIFRWASALPVRQAKALYRQRDEKLDVRRVGEMVETLSPGYVLEVFGLPAIVAHRGVEIVKMKLEQSAYLRTQSGKTLRPRRVDAEVHGLNVTALIHFPRAEPLTLADKEIECYGHADVFAFREKFKLSSMMYLERLEL
jgi:hypothetical protein